MSNLENLEFTVKELKKTMFHNGSIEITTYAENGEYSFNWVIRQDNGDPIEYGKEEDLSDAILYANEALVRIAEERAPFIVICCNSIEVSCAIDPNKKKEFTPSRLYIASKYNNSTYLVYDTNDDYKVSVLEEDFNKYFSRVGKYF